MMISSARLSTLLVLIIVISLGGCATLSKEECLQGDWRLVGYGDGVNGSSPNRISDHRRACSDYGITPDLQAYNAGRAQGLEIYCRPRNGYKVGRQGDSYKAACPARLEAEFLTAYDAGKDLYEMDVSIRANESSLNSAMNFRYEAKREIEYLQAEIIKEGTSEKKRRQLVQDLNDANEKLRRLELDIDEIRYLLDEQDAHRARLLDQHRAWR